MEAKTIQKYQFKSVPDLIKIATKHFNDYIRKRDQEKGWFKCISCGGTKHLSKMHAGHYLSAGHNGAVRFDENNVHGQCDYCNTFLHGNLIPYQKNIILKIGSEAVEALEMKSKMRGFKWDRFTLIDIIETYKIKNKTYGRITDQRNPNQQDIQIPGIR